jgi:hypothetical protein
LNGQASAKAEICRPVLQKFQQPNYRQDFSGAAAYPIGDRMQLQFEVILRNTSNNSELKGRFGLSRCGSLIWQQPVYRQDFSSATVYLIEDRKQWQLEVVFRSISNNRLSPLLPF